MTCWVVPFVNGQSREVAQLERLKKNIRQSTLYDSTIVFTDGKKAILLAKKLNKPIEEGIIYQYYGNFYYYSNQLEKASDYYQRAISVAKAHHNIQLVNSTEIRLAFILSETDILKGEQAFIRLLHVAQKNKLIENQIEAYNGLGIVSENRLMRDKAVAYYLKGLRIAEKHNKKYFIAFLLNNLGLLKYNNKQYKEAQVDLERGLKLGLETQEWRLVGNLQNNLGLVTRELKDYPAAIRHYQATVRMTRKLGFPLGIGAAYINLADSYQSNNQFQEAAIYADSAIALFQQMQQPSYLGMALLLKGSIAVDLNDVKTAQFYVSEVDRLLKQQLDVENYIARYKLMSKIAEKMGDYRQAFLYKNRFYELTDSIEEITNHDKLTDLEVQYGKERLDNQLKKEKAKNELLAKDNQLKSAKWRFVLLIVFSAFIVFVGWLYFRYLNNLRKQQALFSQRLIRNVDEERSRISKDLHDDIGQLLSVVKSKVNMFQTGRLDTMDGLESEIGEIIEHTRVISHELHPSSLEKIGLERALVSMLEKTQIATGIFCNLSVPEEVKTLPIHVQTQLYRIFQECINNTIKHSEAKALKVSISPDGDHWLAKYQDNGKGIAEADWKNGLGWLTIRERVRQLPGKMEVSSQPNEGMKLRIKFKRI
jgi:signal transduction histidine kinase